MTMPHLVLFERRASVGIITVNNPPVNALNNAVREGILGKLAVAEADSRISAIVLIGAGKGFIAGADIRELGGIRTPTSPPQDALEQSQKPIVAAIHGYALGGGLEYALACHYRVAANTAKLGLPEAQLGLLPGGGGTQRLPRLIGTKAALDLILSGRHVSALEANRLGLVDCVVEDAELLDAAISFARRIQWDRPLPRTSSMLVASSSVDNGEALAKLPRAVRALPSTRACLEAVQAAATLPFREGLNRERALFAELVNTAEAKALRYAFFAERQTAKVPDLDIATIPYAISSVAIIGGGTMGTGIAMACADAGIPVKLLELDQAAAARAMGRISSLYEAAAKRGALDQQSMRKRLDLISLAVEYRDIADVDFVIEAIFEDMGAKTALFSSLDQIVKPSAIFASNTSALDINEIANATKRQSSVVGAHFFSPANVMKLLEIVRGHSTDSRALDAVVTLSRRLGKVGVICRNGPGFVANRTRAPFSTEANILVEDGAMPDQIDRVFTEFGYPMGPFAVVDLAGGDISYAGRQRRAASDPSYRKLPIADRLVELGRYGQKTSAGWYRYEQGDRTPYPDPKVEQIIKDVRREFGIKPRQINDDYILRRLLFASVNEACRALEEGVATRASDVDVMWLHGFAFPRHRGGLMYWADRIGAAAILNQLEQWETELGARWRPAPLLRAYAAQGRSFIEAQ